MKITYLSGCLVLIVTILGSGNVSGTESCVKKVEYARGKCATNGCSTIVDDGQYTLKCDDPRCRNTDCGTSYQSSGKTCKKCLVKCM
ncbi:hypothetical protein PGT21_007248 [Puccinia graminis f. sp. tritici]|uniref:TNFR-Cys domain-containing protein n=1 Tax=Puccinia graminis f. sp. tritici TaxID=56615 RepID=A0A5B0S4Z9_PUCGR|nr:hypothetical protein PGT21_007248 [Puccinia graminis f. sp. tritici]KAA1132872.1 hypothetical protein PGTUg99_016961 [Puccinia graminis f. sp. tritici]